MEARVKSEADHVASMVNTVSLGQMFLQNTSVFLSKSFHHTKSVVYRQRYMMLATDSVV